MSRRSDRWAVTSCQQPGQGRAFINGWRKWPAVAAQRAIGTWNGPARQAPRTDQPPRGTGRNLLGTLARRGRFLATDVTILANNHNFCVQIGSLPTRLDDFASPYGLVPHRAQDQPRRVALLSGSCRPRQQWLVNTGVPALQYRQLIIQSRHLPNVWSLSSNDPTPRRATPKRTSSSGPAVACPRRTERRL